MDREAILRLVRDRYEIPIWSLLRELEGVLREYAQVKHVNITDQRAVGSTLNCALMDAAVSAKLADYGLAIVYCQNGRSNKISGRLQVGGHEYTVSMELHLAGPKGGTSKSAHQFAGSDIDLVWTLPGIETTAPDELLFFVACHLDITGVSVSRTYLKYADGVDQRSVQLQRPLEGTAAPDVGSVKHVEGPAGTRLVMKQTKGEQNENGITTDQRRDAASSS